MSYAAIVCRIHTRPHPNADRLQLGTCLGNQVVVGLDTQDGELGFFFPTDGQLSHRYCLENHLYTASARARLGLPDGPTGFVDHNRRVRAQRFRQERSDGLWMPLASLSWTGVDLFSLREGTQVTELGGQLVCEKYYTPATRRALGAGKGRVQKHNKYFLKHEDTKQFRFVADDIPEDAVLYLTEKLHGTSGRYAHVLDELKLGRVKRAINWVAKHLHLRETFPTQAWTYLNGSKNVILEKADARRSYYGTDDFRFQATDNLTLHKGEILYFELVGWVSEDKPIMPPHKIAAEMKDIRKQYGEHMHYTYGAAPGMCRMYVYKIVHVNEDGVSVEMPWSYVVQRCHELGLAHVPLLLGPTTLSHLSHLYSCDKRDALRMVVEEVTEGQSTLDPTQIREGVVLRVESSIGISHIKNKSHLFGVLEGYIKDDSSYVDLEEVS